MSRRGSCTPSGDSGSGQLGLGELVSEGADLEAAITEGTDDELRERATKLVKSGYGSYLLNILERGR